MMPFYKYKFLFFTLFLVVSACSPKIRQVEYQNKTKELFSSKVIDHPIDTIISPYRESLEEEMGAFVGSAECTMTKERPEGTLGNFTADLLQEFALNYFADSASNLKIITLLNNGGLRAPINSGDILISSVFELMPFDNEIVFVKVKKEKFQELIDYLEKTGGEPIAGFRKDDTAFESDFWIATTDYLAEGGDKMTFFQEPLAYISTKRLLRDEIVSFINKQGSVCSKLDKRWY
jgi:2',3'-cyclic-nucleotide 2'-phosphodiesterase (5'-nucleotidase family)